MSEDKTQPGPKLAKDHAALAEARALLDRYEPEKGQGVSLNSPSQGEARRMLACIRGLLLAIEGPSQPVGMLTR